MLPSRLPLSLRPFLTQPLPSCSFPPPFWLKFFLPLKTWALLPTLKNVLSSNKPTLNSLLSLPEMTTKIIISRSALMTWSRPKLMEPAPCYFRPPHLPITTNGYLEPRSWKMFTPTSTTMTIPSLWETLTLNSPLTLSLPTTLGPPHSSLSEFSWPYSHSLPLLLLSNPSTGFNLSWPRLNPKPRLNNPNNRASYSNNNSINPSMSSQSNHKDSLFINNLLSTPPSPAPLSDNLPLPESSNRDLNKLSDSEQNKHTKTKQIRREVLFFSRGSLLFF